MATVKVTDSSFSADVLQAEKPVLVDFWAEWCGPCKAIAPALEDIAEKLGDRLTVAKINIDDNPSTPSTYNVKGIPMLMLFKDGEVAATKMGALPPQKLTEWIEDALE
jgi:thioredoxin 1